MSNPSVSIPDDLLGEIDDRRHANTPRSTFINEASLVRLHLENNGEWDAIVSDAKASLGVELGIVDQPKERTTQN